MAEIAGCGRTSVLHLRPDGGQPRLDSLPVRAVFLAGRHEKRRRVVNITVHHRLRGIPEKRAERIKILLGNGVELVVVAGGATHGQAQPDRSRGIGAILGVDFRVFVLDDAGFVGGDIAAVKAGGDELVERGVGQQVSGQLLDAELVEADVAVECLNHPVAIRPDFAVVVDMDAVGVGVARRIQPITGAVLAVMRRSQVAVHHALVRVG